MSVGSVCTREVITIGPEDSVIDAARLMRSKGVGTLVVVEGEAGSQVPVGLVTDRDIAVGVVAVSPEHINTLSVSDILVRELVTTEEDVSSWRALQRMRERGIRRMPVLDDAGYLSGIITLDDLLVQLADALSCASQILQGQGSNRR